LATSINGHENIFLQIKEGPGSSGETTYSCQLYGSVEFVELKKKDIPLVVLEEYEKLGSLQNHQEV